VKRLTAAKQRLEASLRPEERLVLSEAMLQDVLAAVGRAGRIDRTMVVTSGSQSAQIARSVGADVIKDEHEQGHSDAALVGAERGKALGALCVALLSADCPLIDPGELDGALESMPDRGVCVIPDRHGLGTNGLLLAPPDVIRPDFGGDSRERHQAAAEAAGVPCAVAPLESAGLDVDTPDDLKALRDALTANPERAPKTAAVLDRLGKRAFRRWRLREG
jgi:2-phospho-L-lactate/phosphoenolpyruvate guanylyltransferase